MKKMAVFLLFRLFFLFCCSTYEIQATYQAPQMAADESPTESILYMLNSSLEANGNQKSEARQLKNALEQFHVVLENANTVIQSSAMQIKDEVALLNPSREMLITISQLGFDSKILLLKILLGESNPLLAPLIIRHFGTDTIDDYLKIFNLEPQGYDHVKNFNNMVESFKNRLKMLNFEHMTCPDQGLLNIVKDAEYDTKTMLLGHLIFIHISPIAISFICKHFPTYIVDQFAQNIEYINSKTIQDIAFERCQQILVDINTTINHNDHLQLITPSQDLIYIISSLKIELQLWLFEKLLKTYRPESHPFLALHFNREIVGRYCSSLENLQ